MLIHLVFKIGRSVLWVSLIALLLGAAGALVRVLPWIVADDVPWSVSFTFFRTLVLASTEVALFIALPLGCALEVVRWTHDWVALTLRSLGVGPYQQAMQAMPVALIVGLFTATVSYPSALIASYPGVVSNSLLDTAASQACRHERAVRVPALPVAWLCSQHQKRLVGWYPAHHPPMGVLTASHARFTPAMDRLELEDVVWVSAPSSTLRARNVVITGVVPGVVAARIPPALRAFAFGSLACLAALGTSFALLRWPLASRPRALVVGTSATLGMLLGNQALTQWSWLGWLVVALLTLCGPIAFAWATRLTWLPITSPGGT